MYQHVCTKENAQTEKHLRFALSSAAENICQNAIVCFITELRKDKLVRVKLSTCSKKRTNSLSYGVMESPVFLHPFFDGTKTRGPECYWCGHVKDPAVTE